MFVEVGLEKQYDEGYGPLSGIEHSDATAYAGMVAGVDTSSDERPLDIHSDLLIPHYLRNAFQYFGDVFRICNQTNPLADASRLEGIIVAGLKFYETDMRARGQLPF
jgi:hypothetical protein